jgi:hypothetical protein
VVASIKHVDHHDAVKGLDDVKEFTQAADLLEYFPGTDMDKGFSQINNAAQRSYLCS